MENFMWSFSSTLLSNGSAPGVGEEKQKKEKNNPDSINFFF